MKPNKFCDIVPHHALPSERLGAIEGVLAGASALVRRHRSASGIPSSVDFFAELMRKYRKGSAVQVGNVTVPPEEAAEIMEVKEVEGELLAGFSRLINKATLRCGRAYGRPPEELQADAYEAFFRAMVNYSGETRFSTYLWHCLNRNLCRVCLDKGELKVPRDVRRIAMRVVESMHKDGVTFDEAVESVGLSEKQRPKVVASMSRVCSATELEVRESDMATSRDSESFGWVSKAVEDAGLGHLERAVLKGFMEAPAGVMGLSEGCRDLINPDTGRPYSRAALSSAWRQARKKIARAMGEVA